MPEKAVEGEAVAEQVLGMAGESAAGQGPIALSPQLDHIQAEHARQALQPLHLKGIFQSK